MTGADSGIVLLTVGAILVTGPAVSAGVVVGILSGLLIWRPGWTLSTTSVVPVVPALGVPATIAGALVYAWLYEGLVAPLGIQSHLPLMPTALAASGLIALCAWGTARWFAYVARDTASVADPRSDDGGEGGGGSTGPS